MGEVADWARPVVHWEIEARDAERQRAFYAELFSWAVGDGPIMQIPPGIGGPEAGVAGHIRESGRSSVNLYVQVRDVHESLRRVEELGGSVAMPPFDVPGGGATLAVINDPEDNQLVLVQQ